LTSRPTPSLWLVAAALASPALLSAAGPDITINLIQDVRRWDRIGGITAYSIGTTACNSGDTPVQWNALTSEHPVIAQNMYRLKAGRFEQIGLSWLKHTFSAGIGTYCGACQDPMNGQLLGVGCSDAYSSGLNGLQSQLGPRYEVNASTGQYPYPFANPPVTTALDRRIQVADADVDPALNAGALYFIEGQYVSADEAAAGNGLNSVSYRRITITEQSPGNRVFLPALADATAVGKPGILAWQDYDVGVVVVNVDVPGDGRIIVASKATNLGDGFWRYEYAVQNLTSDRSAAWFRVALHPGAARRHVGFHDVAYHSGEPFDSTDWPAAAAPGNADVEWRLAQTFGDNPNANALRWGTLYNFRFDSNSPPVSDAAVTIGLFKPGVPSSVTITTLGPSPQAPDCNGNMIADYLEFQADPALDCDGNWNLDACDPDCNSNHRPDVCDIMDLPSRDCDANGRLDVCEIPVGSPAPGGPFFCTANCAPDCNLNGKPDSCDIASGLDPDCNGNFRPDSCDIALGEPDCDGDAIPDACEILANPALDCNRNGLLDECGEIDCNSNMIPDDCEGPSCPGILAGDVDCDADIDLDDLPGFVNYLLIGQPSCRADLNHDGRVDGLDVGLFADSAVP